MFLNHAQILDKNLIYNACWSQIAFLTLLKSAIYVRVKYRSTVFPERSCFGVWSPCQIPAAFPGFLVKTLINPGTNIC